MIRIPNTFYRFSPADRPPLRIGLLLESTDEIPAFAAMILDDLKASNFARVELLVVRKNSTAMVPRRGPASFARPFTDPKSSNDWLYDLYLRLDARMKPANDPLAKVDCRHLLDGIERIDFEPIGTESAHGFPADALQKIRSKNLDVLIRFAFNPLQGEILKAARYGVWSYHHGDADFYRGSPTCFWELQEGSPLCGVTLRVLSDEPDRGLVLCKAQFATEQTLSVSRNRYNPYWGSTDLMIGKLNELHRFGWDHLLEKAAAAAPYQGKRDPYEIPTNRDMLPWLGPILIKKAISYPFRKEIVQHWRIASRVNGTPLYESGADSDFSGFRWLEPPQGRAWADPFIFGHEGKNWAFFEDYSYQEKRAGIACAEISKDGTFGPPTLCLDHPNHHYSYPDVFRARNEIFMVPESFDSNSVDLYRCQQFPDRWIHEAVLFEGKFVDTTVWAHEGLWWLATTSADPGPGAGSLLLFYSESLTRDWHFHPANPISTDIQQNRGAGRVLQSQGRLIRTSQSCAPTYGYSIAFHEITELSTQRYSERHLKTITPEHWEGISGIHTYNRVGNIELIDGRSPVPLKHLQSSTR